MNNWKSVIAVFIGLLLSITVCGAVDLQLSQLPTPVPVNQTLQLWPSEKMMNASGTAEPVITLVLIQSNSTMMPGPRDMAFGPTWISLTVTPSSLIVVSLLAGVVVLTGFYLIRRRR